MTDKDEAAKVEVAPAGDAVPQHADEYSADKAEDERTDKAPDYKPTP